MYSTQIHLIWLTRIISTCVAVLSWVELSENAQLRQTFYVFVILYIKFFFQVSISFSINFSSLLVSVLFCIWAKLSNILIMFSSVRTAQQFALHFVHQMKKCVSDTRDETKIIFRKKKKEIWKTVTTSFNRIVGCWSHSFILCYSFNKIEKKN